MRPTKTLYRDVKHAKISGVCSGLAEYLGADVSIIRILWVIFTLYGGAGILLYIVAALIIPAKPDDGTEYVIEDDEDNKRLTRDMDRAIIGGVCAGIARQFNIDVSIVRIIFVLMFLYFAFGFFLYIILWLILPKN